MEIKEIDFGIKDYEEILVIQEQLFQNLIAEKLKGSLSQEYLLIGEHFPVITLGRRARQSNILVPQGFLDEKGIKTYRIGRGGDVTYHGPGQLILYPILDLSMHNLSVKDYVNILEETIILLLSEYGIRGERVEGATGVWIGKGSDEERKICAMGIKCSRFCTMHGLALNVTTDLSGFSFINPCGFQDKGVTSIQEELRLGGKENIDLSMDKIKEELSHIFLSLILPFKKVFDFPEELGSENKII